MKTIIITTLAIWMAINVTTLAEIRNGYEKEVCLAEKSMGNLTNLSEEGYSKSVRYSLEERRRDTENKLEELRDYYRKTQILINKLLKVDPALYHEVNTIKNYEGDETDVYVKIVEDLGETYLGITNLEQSSQNPHVHSSEYGDYTVSVMVVRTHINKALKILAHEFGHVRYQVPNLASYMKYYQETYQHQYFDDREAGHWITDPSHLSVIATLKSFGESFKAARLTAKAIASRE